MTKLIYIDVETGGTNPLTNPLLQLSGEIEIDGETKEEFNLFIHPFKGQEVSRKALEVTGLTIEQIKGFMKPENAFTTFTSMLDKYVGKWDKTDKFHFIGYNSRFDEDFLRQFFINNADNDKDKMYGNGYGCYFYTPSLDVMQMAALKLMDNRKDLINFKLETVCNYFGITEENWHDAKADIRATKKLFKELLR